MSWHLIEKVIEEAGKHSTWLGKIWILSLFFFRILIITRIGDTVYHDEQAAFRCNNRQPGCENVCFSQYSPLSFIRFCAFQVIMVAVPMVCYILYSAHVVAMSKKLNPNGIQNSIFKIKLDRRQIGLTSRGLPTTLAEKQKGQRKQNLSNQITGIDSNIPTPTKWKMEEHNFTPMTEHTQSGRSLSQTIKDKIQLTYRNHMGSPLSNHEVHKINNIQPDPACHRSNKSNTTNSNNNIKPPPYRKKSANFYRRSTDLVTHWNRHFIAKRYLKKYR